MSRSSEVPRLGTRLPPGVHLLRGPRFVVVSFYHCGKKTSDDGLRPPRGLERLGPDVETQNVKVSPDVPVVVEPPVNDDSQASPNVTETTTTAPLPGVDLQVKMVDFDGYQ